MQEILHNLNEAQREAVTTTEGFVRVIAGAGSGKTRALSHRFAYLVNVLGILPGHILCVTFTNKSAHEMRQRIHSLTGDRDTGYINTFHGFCVSVLQEDIYAVQYPRNFLVLDNSDIDAMLKRIYEEKGLTLRNMTFSKARDMIEMRKLYKEPQYYRDLLEMSLEALQQKYEAAQDTADSIFYGYLYQCKKCFGLDYNDLIKFTLYLFQENADIRLKWQKRLEYIMIDEFQDIDALQYELMDVLCGYHKNLFIVGDPDQTIYTWRGANVKYLLEFEKKYPRTKTIALLTNYRSTPQILAVANDLIDKNKMRIKKYLIPFQANGKPVLCQYAANSEEEAKWIVEQIRKLQEDGAALQDITILYRAHYITRTLETVFLKEKLPYTIYSGVPFWGRMEIKDVLSYLRLIAYKDDLSFLRVVNVPKRNIGKRRIEFLQEYAAQNQCTLYEALCSTIEQDIFKGTKAEAFLALTESIAATYTDRSVSEVLVEILDKSGYEAMLRTEGSQERLDNLAELKQSIFEYEISCGEETTLEDYLAHVALFTGSDTADNKGKVKMMTVHAAKGLEFPYVFLCSMNEGVFPSGKITTLEGMEEERRLAFVAVTRAEKRLFLSEAAGRNFDSSPRYPSRFLLDIRQELLTYEKQPDEGLIREAKAYIGHKARVMEMAEKGAAFSVGQRVRHIVFGEGEIIGIAQEESAYVIQFDRFETTRKIAFRVALERC